MNTDPDVKLMLKFKDGDEHAFRRLFAKYQIPIINFCFRFCSDRTLAEDLAQDTFIRVYKAAERYKPKARFSTWIYKIAVNVCLNESRKQKYKYNIQSMDQPKRTDENRLPEYTDENAPTTNGIMEAKEREAIIKQALTHLPEQQRMAMVLRTSNDFSYDEIADQMSVSKGKVKTLIFRARKQLKERLGHIL